MSKILDLLFQGSIKEIGSFFTKEALSELFGIVNTSLDNNIGSKFPEEILDAINSLSQQESEILQEVKNLGIEINQLLQEDLTEKLNDVVAPYGIINGILQQINNNPSEKLPVGDNSVTLKTEFYNEYENSIITKFYDSLLDINSMLTTSSAEQSVLTEEVDTLISNGINAFQYRVLMGSKILAIANKLHQASLYISLGGAAYAGAFTDSINTIADIVNTLSKWEQKYGISNAQFNNFIYGIYNLSDKNPSMQFYYFQSIAVTNDKYAYPLALTPYPLNGGDPSQVVFESPNGIGAESTYFIEKCSDFSISNPNVQLTLKVANYDVILENEAAEATGTSINANFPSDQSWGIGIIKGSEIGHDLYHYYYACGNQGSNATKNNQWQFELNQNINKYIPVGINPYILNIKNTTEGLAGGRCYLGSEFQSETDAGTPAYLYKYQNDVFNYCWNLFMTNLNEVFLIYSDGSEYSILYTNPNTGLSFYSFKDDLLANSWVISPSDAYSVILNQNYSFPPSNISDPPANQSFTIDGNKGQFTTELYSSFEFQNKVLQALYSISQAPGITPVSSNQLLILLNSKQIAYLNYSKLGGLTYELIESGSITESWYISPSDASTILSKKQYSVTGSSSETGYGEFTIDTKKGYLYSIYLFKDSSILQSYIENALKDIEYSEST